MQSCSRLGMTDAYKASAVVQHRVLRKLDKVALMVARNGACTVKLMCQHAIAKQTQMTHAM